MIVLNLQEREYFASFLEQEVRSDQAMIEQLGQQSALNKAIVERYKLMASARSIVAKDLRRVEIQEVAG